MKQTERTGTAARRMRVVDCEKLKPRWISKRALKDYLGGVSDTFIDSLAARERLTVSMPSDKMRFYLVSEIDKTLERYAIREQPERAGRLIGAFYKAQNRDMAVL